MSNNSKPILICKIIILSFFSCNNNHETNRYKKTTDKIQVTPQLDNNIQSRFDTITSAEELYGKGVVNLDLLEANIIFDDNFNPYLFVKLKNNMKMGVMALEIVIDPSDKYHTDCEKIIVKKTISIPPNKTVKFKERIDYKVARGCLKIEEASIYLGDFILTNGKKTQVLNSLIDSIANNIN